MSAFRLGKLELDKRSVEPFLLVQSMGPDYFFRIRTSN